MKRGRREGGRCGKLEEEEEEEELQGARVREKRRGKDSEGGRGRKVP